MSDIKSNIPILKKRYKKYSEFGRYELSHIQRDDSINDTAFLKFDLSALYYKCDSSSVALFLDKDMFTSICKEWLEYVGR